ncbi:MAG TPA: hypothetical protein VF450_19110, partial [Noviherbaspirillum sp.]
SFDLGPMAHFARFACEIHDPAAFAGNAETPQNSAYFTISPQHHFAGSTLRIVYDHHANQNQPPFRRRID